MEALTNTYTILTVYIIASDSFERPSVCWLQVTCPEALYLLNFNLPSPPSTQFLYFFLSFFFFAIYKIDFGVMKC